MISIDKFNKGKSRDKIDKYYIAYGSNMDLNQMSYRAKDSIFIGTGYLENYRLEFKSRYATIRKENNSKVPVIIFGISKEDEIRLDRYEGYPELYYKEEVKIKLNESEEKECMVYIMEEKYNKYQLPEVNYYLNMETSYKTFKFNIDILEKALIESYRNSKDKEMYNLIIIDKTINKVIENYESESIETLMQVMKEKSKIEDIECYISDKDKNILYFSEGEEIYRESGDNLEKIR